MQRFRPVAATLLLISLFGAFLTPSPASATVITIDFTGRVSAVNDPNGFLSLFGTGDLVTGRFSYEAGALPGSTYSDADLAYGTGYGAPLLQSVSISGYSFTTNAAGGLQVYRYVPFVYQSVTLGGQDTSDALRGAGYSTTQSVVFGDFTGNFVDANLALPAVEALRGVVAAGQALGSVNFPVPGAAMSSIAFSIDGLDGDAGAASVDSDLLRPVPEPPAAWLLATGSVLVLFGLGARRARSINR